MSKQRVLLVFSFLIALSIIYLIVFSNILYKTNVSVGGNVFSVEVADTSRLLEKGLSGHEPLAPNSGMLFVFKTSDKYGFWMKDMLFSLDIIWISQDFKVVHIEKNLSSETYPKIFYPSAPSLYVLEVSAGIVDLLKIKTGDSVQITKKWL